MKPERVLDKLSTMRSIAITFILSFLLISCSTNKKKQEAESTIISFFDALKFDETDSMVSLYPSIEFLINYRLSDSAVIFSTDFINDSTIKVGVESSYTNGFGKKTNSRFYFYLLEDSIGHFNKISDSNGFSDFEENRYYKFALAIGCLTKLDSTDCLKSLAVSNAEIKAIEFVGNLYKELSDSITIDKFTWRTGYGGSASGDVMVKNKSSIPISNIKYVIYFKNPNGDIVAEDDGYVTYSKLYPNQLESFSFYKSYVGNAKNASVMLRFDTEEIEDIVLSKSYKGNECDFKFEGS